MLPKIPYLDDRLESGIDELGVFIVTNDINCVSVVIERVHFYAIFKIPYLDRSVLGAAKK